MTPTAGEAIGTAEEWVRANAAGIRGFAGAYTVGSFNAFLPDDPVPPTSDLDIMVVVDVPDAPPKPGKMRVNSMLLEVTFLALDDVREPETVLRHYHLAPGVATARILSDPTGHLDALQRDVRELFREPLWVRRRTDMARDTVLDRLDAIDPGAPLHMQAMSVLFAAGGVPHILLAAACRNPTVRKRFEAARALLDDCGLGGEHAGLLTLLGSERVTPDVARGYLVALEPVFDVTGGVIRTPVPFATDLLPESRPIAIDGSREAIRAGNHREAMFWIAVTFTRCMTVLQSDGPQEATRAERAYRAMLGDLGIASAPAIRARAERIRQALPGVEKLARDVSSRPPAARSCSPG